jgi:hypothetical protein
MMGADRLHFCFGVKNQNIFKVIAKVCTFVRPQYSQRKTDERPQVDNRIVATEMFAQFMNLGMTVVATGNTIIGACCLDLLIFKFSVLQAFFLHARLQESAAAAATVIVGSVGLHVDEVFLADNGFDNKAQVFGYGISVAFANNLAGILYGKLDFKILVPVGIDFESSFPDPFGVIFVNIFYLKIVLKVEFFQSGPD